MSSIRWFSWDEVAKLHGKNLPHYRQKGAVYFITMRLNDSVPLEKIAEWQGARDRWLAMNPSPHSEQQELELYRCYSGRIEEWVDAGHGSCVLRQSAARKELADVLRYGDGKEYRLGEFVTMPNHVHVLVHPLGDADLDVILGQWKSISAHKINKAVGREGELWQPEVFDHIARNVQSFRRSEDYIRGNPNGLPDGPFTLGKGSLVVD